MTHKPRFYAVFNRVGFALDCTFESFLQGRIALLGPQQGLIWFLIG
jgi:hypothetical protein